MSLVVEIINTGSELMLGRVLNTHQQWLCRQLADRGYLVSRQVAVPDTGPAIQQAVRESLGRADLVVCTGGLGPTSDDITRDLIAQLLGKELKEDPEVARHIRSLFAARKRPMPERILVQAMVPQDALVLANPNGTAPGLAMQVASGTFRNDSKSSWLVMLPGPPRELRPMFLEAVVPLLSKVLPQPNAFVCRTLRSIGVGESIVESRIAPKLQTLVDAGLQIGYCARPGRVDVRLASNLDTAAQVVAEAETIVRAELGATIYGNDDEEQEKTLVEEMSRRKLTLALAESCTGGYLANLITNVPGASAVLIAGAVTYSNQAKQKLLGVKEATLKEHGAVSRETAAEMAEGIRCVAGADFALSVTGIAGPAGGTPAKPVGTVFIGLASKSGVEVVQNHNPLDRETFKQVTAQQALDLLRRAVLAG